MAVFGENARYVSREDLKNGAFIDAAAAQILNERGIDTGLISRSLDTFSSEAFPGHALPQIDLQQVRLHRMEVSPRRRS